MLINKHLFLNRFFQAGATAVISLIVYIRTLAPTVTFQDSGDFIASAYGWGIAHPSSYPLYTLLGKLYITIIPFNSIAWRVNLLSACAAAVAVGFLYLVVFELTGSRIAAVGTSLFFAFSRWLWSQAVIAEVYTLNIAFMIIILYMLLTWQKNRKQSTLAAVFFIYGLSLSNHLMMVLFLPAVLIFVGISQPSRLRSFKNWGIFGGALALGLLPYLYLPIAATALPLKNYGDPRTLEKFIDVITMQDYRKHAPFRLFQFLIPSIKLLGKDLLRQFSPYLVWLGLLGIMPMFRLGYKRALLLSILFVTFLAFGLNSSNIMIVNAHFYLPVYMIWAILSGLGIAWALSGLKSKVNLSIGVSVVVLMVAVPFLSNFEHNDKSNDDIADKYARAIFAEMKPNAILLATRDSVVFPIQYLQQVEGIRRDVSVIPVDLLTRRWYFELFQQSSLAVTIPSGVVLDRATLVSLIAEQNIARRPVYCIEDLDFADGLYANFEGRIMKVESIRRKPEPIRPFDLAETQTMTFENDAEEPLSQPFGSLVYLQIAEGDIDGALQTIDKGLLDLPHEPYLLAMASFCHLQKGDPTKAISYANAAIKEMPSNYLAFRFRGRSYWLLGFKVNAINDLKNSLAFSLEMPSVGGFSDLELMAQLLIEQGEQAEARKLLVKYINGYGAYPQAQKAVEILSALGG